MECTVEQVENRTVKPGALVNWRVVGGCYLAGGSYLNYPLTLMQEKKKKTSLVKMNLSEINITILYFKSRV